MNNIAAKTGTVSYTAFGSGVSTEISALSRCPRGVPMSYTAFGSGVSTEMFDFVNDNEIVGWLHSLRLRGEH